MKMISFSGSILIVVLACLVVGCASPPARQTTYSWFLDFAKKNPTQNVCLFSSAYFNTDVISDIDGFAQNNLVCGSASCGPEITADLISSNNAACNNSCKSSCSKLAMIDKRNPDFSYKIQDIKLWKQEFFDFSQQEFLKYKLAQAELKRQTIEAQWEERRTTCDKMGFKRKDSSHAACVQDLYKKEIDIAQRNKESREASELAERQRLSQEAFLAEQSRLQREQLRLQEEALRVQRINSTPIPVQVPIPAPIPVQAPISIPPVSSPSGMPLVPIWAR